MTIKNMNITRVSRFPHHGDGDELDLQSGVNVIVGESNTGKTAWLAMLDFLMGGTDTASDALGDLADKYESASALITLGREEVLIERRWKAPGLKSKVLLNDTPIDTKDFSAHWLDKLGIPRVRFPQGNPYGARSWTSLGFRSLLRHMYRRQKMWGDLADKQPESEQHACLVQFLGVAENLFSEDYGALVDKSGQITSLTLQKEQFAELLQDISRDIIRSPQLAVAPTFESIDAAIASINGDINQRTTERESILVALRNEAAEASSLDGGRLKHLSEKWSELHDNLQAVVADINRVRGRLEELRPYLAALTDEVARLNRAKEAGHLLCDLRVTHCPACDQPVTQPSTSSDTCFLCGRAISVTECASAANARMESEINQLESERDEALGLVEEGERELSAHCNSKTRIEEDIRTVESQLSVCRSAATAIMPPDVALIDMEIGCLRERANQILRLRSSLRRRDGISQKIDALEKEVRDLEGNVKDRVSDIPLARLADTLEEGMNSYLNALNTAGRRLWTTRPVAVNIKERSFGISVGGRKWHSALGCTFTMYLVLAYHYSLLSLSNRPGFRYPGVAILDFPGTLEDGTSIADKENFAVEPFISLLSRPAMAGTQMIVSGHAFKDLKGAHRIELKHLWC